MIAQATTLEGFESYVSELVRRPMGSALVGGAPVSENTIAPSLHGAGPNLSLEKAVAIAASVYTHNTRLDDGDYLEFNPSAEALAYADGSDAIDDDELVSVASDRVEAPAKFGRITIQL
ncbi:hypothetical protein D3C71_1783940 [compost metagenome]